MRVLEGVKGQQQWAFWQLLKREPFQEEMAGVWVWLYWQRSHGDGGRGLQGGQLLDGTMKALVLAGLVTALVDQGCGICACQFVDWDPHSPHCLQMKSSMSS